MILTVTLDPSIEKTVVVDGLDIDKENSVQDYRLTLGASAIYSALIIKCLQGEPYVLGFSGGIGGRYIKTFMDKNKIKSDMLVKDCETRSITNLIDSINMTTTKLIDDTFFLQESDIKNLKQKLNNSIKTAEMVVINNNHMDDPIREEMIKVTSQMAKSQGLKIILSLSGTYLRRGIEQKPYGVVINENDLRELQVDYLDGTEAILKYLHELIQKNSIKYLLYYAEDAIYLIAKHKICMIHINKEVSQLPMNIRKDIIVGAVSICSSRKYELEKTAKMIGSVLAAVNMEEYPNILKRKTIDDFFHKLKVMEVYNEKNGVFNHLN